MPGAACQPIAPASPVRELMPSLRYALRRWNSTRWARAFVCNLADSTDSEVIFRLALTLGLEDDPVAALEQAIGLVEATARRHHIDNAVQASIGVSDGECLWAVRYSTEGKSRTLFASEDVKTLRQLHPEHTRLALLRDDDRVVVSEPLVDLPGAWHEIPEATVLVVFHRDEMRQSLQAPHRSWISREAPLIAARRVLGCREALTGSAH